MECLFAKTSKYFTKTPFFILHKPIKSVKKSTKDSQMTKSLELYKLFEIIPNVSKCKRYYSQIFENYIGKLFAKLKKKT